VLWTLGVSYDHFNQSEEGPEVNQANPKFGIQWNVTDDVRLRGGAFRTAKPALVNNTTLEPTQVAGFNQFFDDLNATKSWEYGLGIDWTLTKDLFTGAELTWRNLDEPVLDGDSTKFEERDEQLYRGYLYWTPMSRIAFSAELIYDRYHADQGTATESETEPLPRKVDTLSVPLSARYFHQNGFFAGASMTYVDQQVRRMNFDEDDFIVVDTLVGYRFPKRFGIASLEVDNLLDTEFRYQDNNFRDFRDEPVVPRYFPKRAILGRITINF
jgi:outer membrane receptor protein involved in Fe transport